MLGPHSHGRSLGCGGKLRKEAKNSSGRTAPCAAFVWYACLVTVYPMPCFDHLGLAASRSMGHMPHDTKLSFGRASACSIEFALFDTRL